MRQPVPAFGLAVLLVAGLTACTYAPRYDDGRGAYLHDYYYYPHVGVYFHLYSGHYYYRDGKGWVRVRVLPSHLYLDHRARRPLVIRTVKPYKKYEAHRERYGPPHDFKRDRAHDRAEREHNRRRHKEYLNRFDRPAPGRH